MSLNTTPRTWVAGEVVTAAHMNAEVRDALTGVQAAWTPYTPTLGSWTLGNGTIAGRYMRVGKTIDFTIILTTGSTTSYSSGPNFSLPVTALTLGANGRRPVGTVDLFDTSGAAHRHYFTVLVSTTTCAPVLHDGTAVSPTVPWTWATGDIIELSGTYEAA